MTNQTSALLLSGNGSSSILNASSSSSSSSSSSDDDGIDCPFYTEEWEIRLEDITFWVEGVLCIVIAIPGFLGNISSAYVLSRKGEYCSIL